jgi:multiple sugar transport system permease protein
MTATTQNASKNSILATLGAVPRHAAFYLLLAAIAFIDLFPFIWILLSSFKTQLEIFRWPPTFFPQNFVWDNYADALALLPAGQQPVSDIPYGLANSVVISLISTVLILVLGALAGYAFGRLRFPGRRALLITLMMLRMLPGIVLSVPLFILATRVHLFDTRAVLVITYTAFNLPFAVWLLSVFFQEIPRELEDAALVDGCTRASVLPRIYLPLSLPALATIAILSFLATWNEFLFAVTLTSSKTAKTTPVALASMQAAFQTRWAVMTAGAVLASIPVLLLLFFAQRYIVRGLTFGAVKG